jgi:hypothetical protein
MFNELECVALTCDLPEHGLKSGDVGTVVYVLSDRDYIVEFIDRHGDTVAVIDLPLSQLRLADNDDIENGGPD